VEKANWLGKTETGVEFLFKTSFGILGNVRNYTTKVLVTNKLTYSKTINSDEVKVTF
jgi:hypothetical protein